jgi:uncharacterized protein (DUF302 family)
MHHLMQMIYDTFQHSKTFEEHRQLESESIDLFNLLSKWAIHSLAMIGLLLVIIIAFLYIEGRLFTQSFNSEFIEKFSEFTKETLDTNITTAMTINFPLKSGISVEQAIKSLKNYAQQMNITVIDISSLKTKKAENAKESLFVFEIVDSELEAQLLKHNPDFSAFLPFRIALHTDKNQAWLTTMDVNLLIYGSRNLDENIKIRALMIRDELLKMMSAGANGA